MTQFFTWREDWIPHQYQKDAVRFCEERTCSLVLADPGMGKTSITLSAIVNGKTQGYIKKTLVVAPVRAAYNSWPGELTKWSNFKELTYTLITSANKEKAIQEDVDIYIITTDLVKWLFNAEVLKSKSGRLITPRLNFDRVEHLNFDLLVIDELSKFKNLTSARTRVMLEISKLFERRIGLTGSFAPNNLEDIFAETRIIAGDGIFGKFITNFREKYFYKLPTYGRGYQKLELKPDAVQRACKAIAPVSFLLKTEDYLDMPDMLYTNLYSDLPSSALLIYKSLERKFIADLKEYSLVCVSEIVPGPRISECEDKVIYLSTSLRQIALLDSNDSLVKLDLPDYIDLDNKKDRLFDILSFTAKMKATKRVTVKSAVTKAMALRQVASGGIYAYDSVGEGVTKKLVQRLEHIHNAKSEVLKDLISELQGQPLLILYHFKHDKKRICDLMGDIPDLSMCNTPDKLNALISRWNTGAIPLMLGQPQSMGHGLNLQHGGHHICFYSLDWSFENYDQSIRRLYRQGNKHSTIYVYHILAKGTIDDYLLKILNDKEETQDNILKYLNEYCKGTKNEDI